MNQAAAGGRKSFELMGGTHDQEAWSPLKSWILRTVSFQALPKKILNLRFALMICAVMMLAIDAVDSWMYAKQF